MKCSTTRILVIDPRVAVISAIVDQAVADDEEVVNKVVAGEVAEGGVILVALTCLPQ